MGYGYGRTASGRWALACDSCGKTGGVRKRTCPHKVLTDSLRSSRRHSIPYCYPSALCAGCYATHKATLHEGCAEGAARSTAQADAIEAGLDAGDLFVVSACGDWQKGVPLGMTAALFAGRSGKREYLMPADLYDPSGKARLSQYPSDLLVAMEVVVA